MVTVTTNISFNCNSKCLSYTDTTGSVATNPLGYGAPNSPELSDIAQIRFVLTDTYTGTLYFFDTADSAYFPNAVGNNALCLSAGLFGLAKFVTGRSYTLFSQPLSGVGTFILSGPLLPVEYECITVPPAPPAPPASPHPVTPVECCKTELTAFEDLMLVYQQRVKEYYDNVFAKIYRGEIFGKDCRFYNVMQDINYLGMHFTLLYWDRQADHENNDQEDWKDNDYWYEKYKLTCILKKFSCLGINIKPMIDLFLPASEDGVGFMVIEGTTPPINIVA